MLHTGPTVSQGKFQSFVPSAFCKELFDHSGSCHRYKNYGYMQSLWNFLGLVISILHVSPALMRRADQVSFL